MHDYPSSILRTHKLERDNEVFHIALRMHTYIHRINIIIHKHTKIYIKKYSKMKILDVKVKTDKV